MIMHPKEKEREFPTKEECNTNEKKNSKASSSSRPWSRVKDPRIIRVSRSFGGKDRHSKVCTVKGLRDRRVRLSMPTAIQLYDLQDRLGLDQPSKVVDWLLNAARYEIDKLPPLQIPMGNFGQYLQSIVVSQDVSAPQTSLVSLAGVNKELVKDDGPRSFFLASKGGIKMNNNVDGEDQRTILKSTYLSSDSRPKCKGVGNEESIEGSNTQVPQNSYCHWDPSNLSLSNLGSQGYSYQTEDLHNNNIVQLPSSLSLPYASQILVCPSTITPSFLSSPNVTVDSDPRQVNQIQMLSSTSQNFLSNSLTSSHYSINPPMRPFPLRFLPNGGASTSGFFQNDPKASF